ncbi:hypothetical protein PN498_19905 [Oscillatoria sp. CS-180]|uniref:hypothetical protein n=1 Tax=Oscillatoria sp. CS-180 TaxID=3021720 RepID=UPI00232F47A1|nr:hypothetical protein [Oscillatoria sp. CS-180]MDB9528267.1 hypothetical protein [Oscillatoria sp. CS-180]
MIQAAPCTSALLTPPEITSPELKFLLLLLKYPNYRAPIAQLRSHAKSSIAARDRLCKQLCQKGLMGYEDAITRFGLTATGRTLLKLDRSVLPVTPDEKYVMKSCQESSITPGQIHPRVPKDQRQQLIARLADQGLIRITQRQLGDVWITEAGQRFLREDCIPQGNHPVVSWTLLSDYLRFMRQTNERSVMSHANREDASDQTPV